MTIDDAEHISAEDRAEIVANYPPHEREARTRGIPSLGSGRIFPVADSQIEVPAFVIPEHWARIAGIDFGWEHPTAAVELAWDRDADTVYVINAYKMKERTPLEHSVSLLPWGDNLLWAWPQDAYQRDKRTGGTLRDDYRKYGLCMLPQHATHRDGGVSVEAGLMEMLTRMQTGRFKAFAHLGDWWSEFRMYHRKDGQVFKEFDDLMAATRYAVMMLRHAEAPYLYSDEAEDTRYVPANEVTGY